MPCIQKLSRRRPANPLRAVRRALWNVSRPIRAREGMWLTRGRNRRMPRVSTPAQNGSGPGKPRLRLAIRAARRRHNAPMPDIATALKAEIARVARKEIRSEVESLRKTVTQHRAHIAALRKRVEELERAVKKAGHAKPRAAASQSEEDSQALRFRAGGLASHRKRLGLSAADFGKLLGVSGQSVYKWEAGEVKPRRSQLQAIASVRKMGRREAVARLEAVGAA